MPSLRRLPVTPDLLAAALDPLQAQALAAGAARSDALRLRLVAEELISNSVMHAGCRRIALDLRPRAGAWRLRVLDDGAPWTPAAHTRADAGQVGGWGLQLVGAQSRLLARRRLQGWNLVHVELLPRNVSC